MAWFFAPPRAWNALAGRAAALVDVLRDRRRADEGDRRDVRVVQQHVDGDLVAVHDVEDAVRQARLGVELGHEVRGGGIALGGLEHERVARRDRQGMHPQRDHHREVERRDAGADAERLTERERVDVRGDLVGVLALEQLRDAARVLGHLHAAHDLALGVLDDLAVLARDDPREVVGVLLEEVAEREHDLRAARDGGLAPRSERGLRGGDGGVDVGGLGEHHLGLRLPGRGIPDDRGPRRAPVVSSPRSGDGSSWLQCGAHRRSQPPLVRCRESVCPHRGPRHEARCVVSHRHAAAGVSRWPRSSSWPCGSSPTTDTRPGAVAFVRHRDVAVVRP